MASETRARRAATYHIRERRQIDALTSPARQEIVDALPAIGPCSIAELAEDLGRAPDSLYYHMRLLQRVGLVLPCGTRAEGVRAEALYDTPGARMLIDKEPETARDRKTVLKLISSILRVAERDVGAAFAAGLAVYRRSARRNTTAARTKGWLKRDELAEVLAHVEAIGDIVARGTKRRGSTLHAVTCVLTPLALSERSSQGSKQDKRSL
jgi:DNA-binding transcriptional ArsR family regulator